MCKFESAIFDWIKKYKNILFFIIINALGIVVRLSGKDMISADMRDFLIPWYDTIKSKGGIHALNERVGNYNLLYQTIISFMTYLKGDCVIYYKGLSGFFDYMLAFSAAYFAAVKLRGKKIFDITFNIVYAIILMLPTVVFNSAYWGQGDSIYTTFVVLTLLYLFDEKYLKAFIMLGIAFAFKIQTIFIIPFIVCYYFYKKRFSIFYSLVSIAVFWLSGIVAFFNGGSLLSPFAVYLGQVKTSKQMYMNISSFWILLGDYFENLSVLAIALALALCGIGLYYVMSEKMKIDTAEDYLGVAAWFVWTCLLFLPAMHERYTYPLDILLVMLSFLSAKYLKYAAASVILSTTTYACYLFGNQQVNRINAVVYTVAWLHFTYTILQNNKRQEIS